MVLIPLLAAPSLMLLAVAAERRFGAGVAGAVGAAPLSIALVVLSVGNDGGALAESAAAHVVAQVTFALGFALVEGAAGLATATTAFAATSALIAVIPAPLATLAAGPALLLGSHFLPPKGSDPYPRPSLNKSQSAHTKGSDPCPVVNSEVRAGVGAVAVVVLVGASLAAARVAGPVVAGAVAAFPALSGTLALVVGRGTLPGLVRGLRGYLLFCVTVVALGAPLGVLVGLALAVAQGVMPSARAAS